MWIILKWLSYVWKQTLSAFMMRMMRGTVTGTCMRVKNIHRIRINRSLTNNNVLNHSKLIELSFWISIHSKLSESQICLVCSRLRTCGYVQLQNDIGKNFKKGDARETERRRGGRRGEKWLRRKWIIIIDSYWIALNYMLKCIGIHN